MEEILISLPATAKVLDLGSRTGSYDFRLYPFLTVRVDIDRIEGIGVQADAARLPFASGSFDAVIANHSLEHLDRLEECLREIGRVVRRGGLLYVAVPDAATFTDRLYRWLARGGGHVNAFRSAEELAQKIESATGIHHAATRVLFTALSFLNRRQAPRPIPRRLWLLGGGYEPVLRWLVWMLKQIDSRLGTRLAVYGWAMWFGQCSVDIDLRPRRNVCVACGSADPDESLVLRRRLWISRYHCPRCGAVNLAA